MTYVKPTVNPLESQTEIAGCTPCDGSLLARTFVQAGLGQVYARMFGKPCPAPPLLGPLTVCVNGDQGTTNFCATVTPPGGTGSDVITLP